MSDIFQSKQSGNSLDSLTVNVEALYEKHPVEKTGAQLSKIKGVNRFLKKLYRFSLLPYSWRSEILKVSRRTGLELIWFERFQQYWTRALKGRPLWCVSDLMFFKNLYRLKFQNIEVPDEADGQTHLQTWQKPEVIYQLLHLVTKETMVSYGDLLTSVKKLNPTAKIYLEFGCGTAPIASSMDDFFGWSKVENYWISDIQTLSFHYACWRFSDRDLIKPLLLRVENQFQPVLDRKLDVIFCITVFEHLNDPMETAQRFHQSLNEGGLLVFDYIKSDGHGLDTRFSSIEREKVLRYILDRFEVVEGAIHLDKSVNQVIVRKRSGA